MSRKGHDNTKSCFSYRSKKSCGHWLNAICKSEKHKDPQIIFRKFKVQITSAAKHSHDLMREKLKAQEKDHCNDRTGGG